MRICCDIVGSDGCVEGRGDPGQGAGAGVGEVNAWSHHRASALNREGAQARRDCSISKQLLQLALGHVPLLTL
jgi:hypothetical protein